MLLFFSDKINFRRQIFHPTEICVACIILLKIVRLCFTILTAHNILPPAVISTSARGFHHVTETSNKLLSIYFLGKDSAIQTLSFMLAEFAVWWTQLLGYFTHHSTVMVTCTRLVGRCSAFFQFTEAF